MKHLYFLDYLRVFACLSVLIAHKFHEPIVAILEHPVLSLMPEPIFLFFKVYLAGTAAIIVFFLISGYVISCVLYTNSTVGFLIKRIFRLYPLYIFAVLIQYALIKAHDPNYEIVLSQLIIQLLLLGDFFSAPYTLSGIEWTLRIELLFYMFMLIVRYWMPKGFGAPWFFPVLFGLVVGTVLLIPTLPSISVPSLPSTNVLLYLPFPLLGCTFYLYETRRINIFEFFLFLFLVFFIFWYGSKDSTHLYKSLFIYFYFLGVGVFALSWKFRERFPSNKIILILSPLTYAIYLFHIWLLDYFKEISGSMWAAMVLLLITCYAAHRLIETPMFELGKRLEKKSLSFTIKRPLPE